MNYDMITTLLYFLIIPFIFINACWLKNNERSRVKEKKNYALVEERKQKNSNVHIHVFAVLDFIFFK